VLVVPKGNPAMVQKPEDLLESRVKKIALAGENVPAGKYADQALKKLKLFDELAAAGKFARGQDVRNALQFVETGEAEAGIVYSTDANGSSVQVVYEFDPSLHDKIVYVLLLLKHGDQNPNAKAFFDYAQSAAARDVFSAAGFQLLGAPQ
jgi:molybdate transport system substrate-binding protein